MSSLVPKGDVLLSVCLITYNQKQFIADSIESALMQQADFGVEIVIGDDCSTDGTREICEAYQQRYPDRIRMLPCGENVGLKKNFVNALSKCRGKYIAYLEGDDKWTSPNKLSIQVEVLQCHKDVVLVHTDWVGFDVDTGRYEKPPKFEGTCIREVTSGVICVEREIECSVRQFRGSTILFRREDVLHCIESDPYAYITSNFPAFDFSLCCDLSVLGKFHYIDQVMVTANLHDSLSSSRNPLSKFNFSRNGFYMMAYYIRKYAVPDDVVKLWSRRQMHTFSNMTLRNNLPQVVPDVLNIRDCLIGMGGEISYSQRLLIALMKSGFFQHARFLYRMYWYLR